jgi:hypothetical protein
MSIAVSLDRDRKALTDHIESKGLAAYYGVMAIPLPILVDREGRVVSINLRGPDLALLLYAERK